MSKKVRPVKISLMAGDIVVAEVEAKYFKRDKDGNPITNTRKIHFPESSGDYLITHVVIDGVNVPISDINLVA